MIKIEICKEESINGKWRWRITDKDGSYWANSKKGIAWRASSEGFNTIEDIRKSLDTISRAVASD